MSFCSLISIAQTKAAPQMQAVGSAVSREIAGSSRSIQHGAPKTTATPGQQPNPRLTSPQGLRSASKASNISEIQGSSVKDLPNDVQRIIFKKLDATTKIRVLFALFKPEQALKLNDIEITAQLKKDIEDRLAECMKLCFERIFPSNRFQHLRPNRIEAAKNVLRDILLIESIATGKVVFPDFTIIRARKKDIKQNEIELQKKKFAYFVQLCQKLNISKVCFPLLYLSDLDTETTDILGRKVIISNLWWGNHQRIDPITWGRALIQSGFTIKARIASNFLLGCPNFSDVASRFIKLRLDVANRVDSDSTVHLSGLTALESLHIDYSHIGSTLVEPRLLESLKPLTELKDLTISRGKLCHSAKGQLTQLTQLTSLDLDGCDCRARSSDLSEHDSSFNFLGELTSLSYLHLSVKTNPSGGATGVSNEMLCKLTKLTNLTCLIMDFFTTKDSLEALKQLSALKKLNKLGTMQPSSKNRNELIDTVSRTFNLHPTDEERVNYLERRYLVFSNKQNR